MICHIDMHASLKVLLAEVSSNHGPRRGGCKDGASIGDQNLILEYM